jgi:hypothetical protein
MAANLEESSERNKESGAPNPTAAARPRTKICPSAWPVASGRPTNQDKRGKARHTPHSSPSPPPSSSFPQRKNHLAQTKQARSPPRPPRLLTRYQVSTARTKRNRAVTLLGGRVRERHDKQRPKERRGLWRRGQPASQPAHHGSEREEDRDAVCRGLPSAAVPLALQFWIPNHPAFSLLFFSWAKWSRLSSQVKRSTQLPCSCSRGPRGVARRRGEWKLCVGAVCLLACRNGLDTSLYVLPVLVPFRP